MSVIDFYITYESVVYSSSIELFI